ncbi:MAG: NUDIX domain-containing protein [Reichenbachiella sp.]
MKIYINDIPVRIRKIKTANTKIYDIMVNSHDDLIQIERLKGHVLIENKSVQAIDHLLRIMTEKKHKKVKSIDIFVKNKPKAEEYLKSKFVVIQAAGGIVEKDGKILMILRNDLWDIPKGKLEIGEKKKEGAIREVEEETGAKVKITGKIGTTWHTYTRNRKFVLKNTFWYKMECINDLAIKPQKEENIQKVVWMNDEEVNVALFHSFKTIKRLVKAYRKKRDNTTLSDKV